MLVVTQNNLLLFHRTTKMEKGTNILQNIAHLSQNIAHLSTNILQILLT